MMAQGISSSNIQGGLGKIHATYVQRHPSNIQGGAEHHPSNIQGGLKAWSSIIQGGLRAWSSNIQGGLRADVSEFSTAARLSSANRNGRIIQNGKD